MGDEPESLASTPQGFVCNDLGIANIAVTSTGFNPTRVRL